MRYAKLTLVVGGRGTGKSTKVLDWLRASPTPKKVIYGQSPDHKLVAVRIILPADLHLLAKGVVRIDPAAPKKEALAALSNLQNADLFIDDAAPIIGRSLSEEMSTILIRIRHNAVDAALTYHSLRRVPPELYEMADAILLHKTGEDLLAIRELSKIPEYKNVENAYIQVKNNPSPYYSQLIELR